MTDDDDPEDSPMVRHVLYTNDAYAMLTAFITSLLKIAKPDRVRDALEQILETWDHRVAETRGLYEAMAEQLGEPSGWDDTSTEDKEEKPDGNLN